MGTLRKLAVNDDDNEVTRTAAGGISLLVSVAWEESEEAICIPS